MKTLLLIAMTLVIASHSQAQAKATAEFKTVLTCVTAENPSRSEILVDVQEARGGAQAQMLVKFADEDQVAVVAARKLLPLKYAGKIAEMSNHDILLEIGAPTIKVGKFKGRSSLLSIDQLLSNLPMICTPVID